jgi:hypothetical protein
MDEYIFNPQQYGKRLTITELMKTCGNVAETTLRRFIKSENNRSLGYPIYSTKRGCFHIKSCYKEKLSDIVNPRK